MSLCHCDKRVNGGDELIWSSVCYLFKKANKFDSVQLDATKNGLHLKETKYTEYYHWDEIACCSILTNDGDDDYDDDDHIATNNNINKSNSRQHILESKPIISCFKCSCSNNTKTNGNILQTNQVALQLTIYNGKSRKLKRKQVLLLINTSAVYEENLAEAIALKNKLEPLINKGHATSKPILVILNPKSGKGKTIKLFHDQVEPMLEECGIEFQVLTTKYPNHALQFIENHADLVGSYSAIVTLSGDGLLFEVVNGFVRSIEQITVKKIPIPISIIPGGSGNGLACSINNIFLNGNKSPFSQLTDCALHTIKGQPTAMDMVRISTPNQVYYSFLSFGWGLMADIDIESERLRCLGEPRFTIWSLYRSVALKRYTGTLSYLPKELSSNEINSLEYPVPDSWMTINGEFVMVYAAYQKYLNSTVMFAPDSKLDDETIYLLYIKGDVSFCQIIQFLLNLEDGLHMKLPFVHFVPVKAFRLVPNGQNDIMTIDGEQIACSAVQAQIIPKMASILLRS